MTRAHGRWNVLAHVAEKFSTMKMSCSRWGGVEYATESYHRCAYCFRRLPHHVNEAIDADYTPEDKSLWYTVKNITGRALELVRSALVEETPDY